MCPSLKKGHKLDDEDLKIVCSALKKAPSGLYEKITATVIKGRLNKFPDTRTCPGNEC